LPGVTREIVIAAQRLSSSYTLAAPRAAHRMVPTSPMTDPASTATTRAEALAYRLRYPFRRHDTETFWALRDVSFEVRGGDVLGVVGRPGAGKSTLLRLLSQLKAPTSGEVHVNGRVASLLDVEHGLDPELTGRQHIFLTGAILGMSGREIASRFDEIVDFAGAEPFLDSPVKQFSPEMYVRLAFAAAAHLRAEILVVDDLLVEADAEFQMKCRSKMKELARSGRTIIFVSRDMQAISGICNSAMVLEQGQLSYLGSVEGAVNRYMNRFQPVSPGAGGLQRRPGTGEFRLASAAPSSPLFQAVGDKAITVKIEQLKPFSGKFFVAAHIVDDRGTVVHRCDSRKIGDWFDAAPIVEAELIVRSAWFKPGSYRVDIVIGGTGVVDQVEGACQFEVAPPHRIRPTRTGTTRPTELLSRA
jgi:lipopolysaccharide transport system ATP-binding protein